MPRRAGTFRPRVVHPDSKFGSQLATKFISKLMHEGKRAVAERIFYRTVDLLEKQAGQPGLNVVKQAVTNVRPVLEVKSRRVGGATYQVPVEVRPERQTSLALRWLIQFARARKEKTMEDRLAAEMLAASRNEGSAVKKKEEIHKMAEANRAFAHYRW